MAATLLVLGVVAVVGGIVVFAVSSRLVATMLLAFGALATVTGWLLPVVDRSEALKTGGLAAGSIVALYALWLNDRRRRVDEERQLVETARQDLETARAAYERERAADDRFLRAIELLGHDTDQARVGALHALAGIARSQPSYTQDVLDVICSYLRRPFEHPEYGEHRGKADRTARPVKAESNQADADRWRVVRLSAQRLLADLLPKVGTENAVAYDLDLTGATLEYCDLSHRVIGQLRARALKLYQSNSFHHSEIRGSAYFTETECWGNLWLNHMEFHDVAVFSRVRAFRYAKVNFAETVFHEVPRIDTATFEGEVTPPPGWRLGGTHLVRD
ncbi:hypothetical protein [Actinophytocola sp.]|uniref:hypothetical protein n=1 Tax=Actinophytocola sp. TaxID=1872138 RepID=UPI00389AEE14